MTFNRAAIMLIAASALVLGRSGTLAAQAPPTGATAKCRDGTYSFSKSNSGTCSNHGGVAEWLRAAAPTAGAVTAGVTADLQAYLVYNDRVGFSANIIDNPSISLVNTIIGEGGSGGPSTQTLVTVIVGGVPEVPPKGASVRLVARDTNRVILDRTVGIGMPNAQRQYIAAFLLDDTGCLPVTLTVSLPTLATGTLSKTIPFVCGE